MQNKGFLEVFSIKSWKTYGKGLLCMHNYSHECCKTGILIKNKVIAFFAITLENKRNQS